MRTVQDVAEVQNHWWWRPGWRPGRHYYACHVTFVHDLDLQNLATSYQELLTQFSGLDLIPRPWLHLTMQGIGFTDTISDSEISSITAGISTRLATVIPPRVTFAQPVVRSEAIYLPATPANALDNVRIKTHEAIAEVLGSERSPDANLTQALQIYTPHVSVAYVNSNGSALPYIAALHRTSHDSVTLEIRAVSILTFHRDNRMYEWTKTIPVTVGS